MPFRDTLKENLWFTLLNYEYERHVQDRLLEGLRDDWLDWAEMASCNGPEKEAYLRQQATPFICLSVRQSKELFTAAEQASDATKPVLSYYGMLNLAKGLMAIDSPDFFQNKENLRHGLSVKEGDKHSFRYDTEAVVLHQKGLYSLGRKAIGLPPICAPDERVVVRIADILKALPDLYWDYFKLTKTEPHEMNTFSFGIPDRQFNSYLQQFYVDTHIDKQTYMKVKERLPVDLEEHFIFESFDPNGIHLKSKLSTPNIQELQNLLDTFSTLLLATNNRFITLTFDCQVESKGAAKTERLSFKELELIYLLTFYMSNLARYRPHIWDAAISGRENEFVTLFKRFLYYADSKFIGLVASRVSQLA